MEKLSKKWKSSINFADWYKPKPKSKECWTIVDEYGNILESYIAEDRKSVIVDCCTYFESRVVDGYRPKSISMREWNKMVWSNIKKELGFTCKKITIQIK